MEWTYRNPNSNAKDATRFLIGDTNSKMPLLYDEEIEYFLDQYNNTPLNAGIRCVEAIIAKLSQLCDESVGSVSMSYSQKAEGYRKMLADLKTRLAIEGATPFCGGISKTQKEQVVANPDRVKPDFTKHMMENDQIAPWVTDTSKGIETLNE